MKTWHKLTPVLLLAVALTTGSLALAASAWVSIPSTPDASDKVVIKGGNMPAWTVVTVSIEQPDGTRMERTETIKDDGLFLVEFIPSSRGGYAVKVYDQDGREVGGGRFGY